MQDFEAFERVILKRRSVRLFTKTPVPESVIQKSLDLAMRAPNSSNLQPWEFYWVKDPVKKAELVKACLSQAAAATAQELIVCVARTRNWKIIRDDVLSQLEFHESQGVKIPGVAWDYYKKLVPLAYSQGWLGLFGLVKRIANFFIGLKKPVLREPSSYAQMQIWATKSAALACENFMLAVVAQGFDTCPMEGFDSRRVRKLLQLSSDAVIPMIFAVGERRLNGVTLPHIRADRSRFIKIV